MAYVYKIGFISRPRDDQTQTHESTTVAGVDDNHAESILDQMIERHMEKSDVPCIYKRFVERKSKILGYRSSTPKTGRCKSIW